MFWEGSVGYVDDFRAEHTVTDIAVVVCHSNAGCIFNSVASANKLRVFLVVAGDNKGTVNTGCDDCRVSVLAYCKLTGFAKSRYSSDNLLGFADTMKNEPLPMA